MEKIAKNRGPHLKGCLERQQPPPLPRAWLDSLASASLTIKHFGCNHIGSAMAQLGLTGETEAARTEDSQPYVWAGAGPHAKLQIKSAAPH